MRGQYLGGIAEADRTAFLFTNVVDAKGRSYPGARVAIGARQIYALGMKRPETEIGRNWLDAIAHPIARRRGAVTATMRARFVHSPWRQEFI